MKNAAKTLALALFAIALSGCSAEAPEDQRPTLVVAPFAQTGEAESGPYALALMGITSAVAAEFGSRTDWSVMESDRVTTLEEELDYAGQEVLIEESVSLDIEGGEYAELAGASMTMMTSVELARVFPTADYVLIATVNGYDVAPVRQGGGAALSGRKNRIRSSIDFRIVATETREWVASDTIVLDKVFDDDSRSETQVNAFMRHAATELTTQALRKLAGELVIEGVEDSADKQIVRVSGGSAAGMRVGDRYRVAAGSLSTPATNIEITEVFPSYAVAENAGALLTAGSTFTPVLVQENVATTAGIGPVRVGLMPCLDKNVRAYAAPYAVTVRNRLALYLQDYDGVEVVENRDVIRDKALGEQLLDDLSKGREVGLPLGSLRGVDYLIVCNIESINATAGSSTVETVYGVDVVNKKDGQLRTRGSAYVIDVNSAVRVGSSSVDSVALLDPSDTELVDAADQLAQSMFGALMLDLRPLAIAQVASGRLTLNHKQSVGIPVGALFDVYSPGEDVVANGEMLQGLGGMNVGRLRVTGFDAVGWIQAEMMSGGSVEAGFLLRPADDTSDPASETIW
jgi:curli biogenesis system outer membrane secretion channel CsgG